MPPVQSKLGNRCHIEVKKHLQNLSINLDSARKEGRLCDFLIKVGSREFHVHKIILSEGSDYFRGMFSHEMRETESGVADMQDIDPDCMCICIEYIYTGKVSVPLSKILPLFEAAHLLQLTSLCDALVSFVIDNLDAESYFMAKALASKFGLMQLEGKCNEFARQNFEKISQQEEFRSLDKKTLLSLISDKENKVAETVKLNSMLNWIRFETQKRKKYLRGLHKYIDFSKVPIKCRRQLIEDEPLVHSCSDLMKSICLSVIDSAPTPTEEPKTPGLDAISKDAGQEQTTKVTEATPLASTGEECRYAANKIISDVKTGSENATIAKPLSAQPAFPGFGTSSLFSSGSNAPVLSFGSKVPRAEAKSVFNLGSKVPPEPTTGFTFGGNAPAEPTSGFGFGQKVSTADKTSGFGFGQNVSPAKPTSGLNFGSNVSCTESGFTFGYSVPSAEPISGFGFGSKVPPGPTSGFTFGSSVPPAETTTGFTFGGSFPPAETTSGFNLGDKVSPAKPTFWFGSGKMTSPAETTLGSNFGSKHPPAKSASGFSFGSKSTPDESTSGFKFQ